jgi:hypothetical protein
MTQQQMTVVTGMSQRLASHGEQWSSCTLWTAAAAVCEQPAQLPFLGDDASQNVVSGE